MSRKGISLVTGGLGFIGQHLVQSLIKRGRPVRVLDINSNPKAFHGAADLWTGSVLDKNLLYNAMHGVSEVYHLAALPHLWSLKPEDFYQINVKGTQTMVEVAQHFQISKFVHTSSETVLRAWRDRSEALIDESLPLPQPDELPGPYSRSKLMADHAVQHAIEQGLPGVIVHPTIPIGSGDFNLTPPTRMIRNFLNGKSMAYMECNLNLIPVEAVAEGHIAAAEHGAIGARYILGQENFKMTELLALIEKQIGRKMPSRRVPYAIANLSAHVMEIFARLSKQMPPASVEGVRLGSSNMKFNCTKARQELSLPECSIPKALEETAQWLKEHGHLKS